jgi:NADPH-dependent 2,4-dienoyl-CoA reductase/sulfur reductase-like enzyme
MTSATVDALIVGGGPAGVAAAIAMRKAGVGSVTIVERQTYLGGATRHCSHSPFGMLEFGRAYFGSAYGKRLEKEAAKYGVDVRYGHSVANLSGDGNVLVANHEGLTTLEAKRILVTTGARETTRAARMVPGDRPIGVITTGTLQSYVAFHKAMPFKRPVIVGSELVTMSAIMTCLGHSARPAAVIEPGPYPLLPTPINWFPTMLGIPFHTGAEIVDIRGKGRVEAVVVRRGDKLDTIACDGVLFTGKFTPEASLFMSAGLTMNWGSDGPSVDQFGRCAEGRFFAAGNVLRGVETGGWAFREGTAIGAAMAADLGRAPATLDFVRVTYDEPIKLVVPDIIRSGDALPSGLKGFQLRFQRRAIGTLRLTINGKTAWQRRSNWNPEARIIVPGPHSIGNAQSVHFSFEEK